MLGTALISLCKSADDQYSFYLENKQAYEHEILHMLQVRVDPFYISNEAVVTNISWIHWGSCREKGTCLFVKRMKTFFQWKGETILEERQACAMIMFHREHSFPSLMASFIYIRTCTIRFEEELRCANEEKEVQLQYTHGLGNKNMCLRDSF